MNSTHTDNGAKLYGQWVELMNWMGEYAKNNNLRFDKESDFTDYIYRMERDYDLPTTVQSVSLGLPDGTPIMLASVSPRHEPIKGIHLRLMGAHQAWHLHEHDGHLLEGKRAFSKERLFGICNQVFAIKKAE